MLNDEILNKWITFLTTDESSSRSFKVEITLNYVRFLLGIDHAWPTSQIDNHGHHFKHRKFIEASLINEFNFIEINVKIWLRNEAIIINLEKNIGCRSSFQLLLLYRQKKICCKLIININWSRKKFGK